MEMSNHRAAILLSAVMLAGCSGDDCLFIPGGYHKDYSTGQPGQQMPGRTIGTCKGPEPPAYDPDAEARRNAPFAEGNAYGGKPRYKVDLASAYEHGGIYNFQPSNVLQTSTMKAWMPKDLKKAEHWYRLALKEEKDLSSLTYERAYEGLRGLGADISGLSTPRTRKYTVPEENTQQTALAEAGDPNAAYLLGRKYLSGIDVKKDVRKAANLFAQAAAKGHVEAQVELGTLYVEGRLGEDGKYEKALPLFEQAAEQSSAETKNDNNQWYRMEARYQLGKMYLNGRGVPKDENKGVGLIKTAAENKHSDAQATLAHLYETGTVVNQSHEQAATLYFQSADAQHRTAKSIWKVRNTQDEGEWEKTLFENAISWFGKASDLGHARATFRLAEMNENGDVGKKDKARAIELYRKAASQGETEAAIALKRLGAGI